MAKRKHGSDDEASPNGSAKKARRASASNSAFADVAKQFRAGLLEDPAQLQLLREQYARAKPYKHSILYDLIEDSLLKGVLEEVKTQITFTEKETDIYRIHQSGDLANLDGLDDAALQRLPNLLKLRNALYSSAFRDVISSITSCGPLSGKKTDMAINIYKPGCHLLCHDDVIGSRKVSYILYLTPKWDPRWGGALRLYPTTLQTNSNGYKVHVPSADSSLSIPPRWNQMSMFAVQPGESYHDVEEVYPRGGRSHDDHASDDSQRIRIAISGWFHIPQLGEEGYRAGAEEKQAKKSSLTQLKAKDAQWDYPEAYPIPYPCYPNSAPMFMRPGSWQFNRMKEFGWKLGPTNGDPSIPLQEDYAWDVLSPSDCDYLLRFINPALLLPKRVRAVNREFADSQSIIIQDFLQPKYADELKRAIYQEDKTLSSSTKRITDKSIWSAAAPPHKRRFLYILPTEGDPNKQNLLAAPTKDKPDPDSPIRLLIADFFASMPFRKWLGFATSLVVKSHDLKCRRFRRGLDYQLATPYDEEQPRLEMTLGLTPDGNWEADMPDVEEGKEEEVEMPEPVRNGGTECYLAPDDDAGEEDEDEDMESSSSSESESDLSSISSGDDTPRLDGRPKRKLPKKKHPMPPKASKANDKPKQEKADPAVYKAGANDEDDMLFHMAAGWNRLSLVVRDTGVMKYMSFVNTSAGADRWDITGDYEVDWDKTDVLELDADESSDEEDQGSGEGEVELKEEESGEVELKEEETDEAETIKAEDDEL